MKPFPTQGRLAAIDYGTVRIGIAICDPDRILASPHEVRDASDWQSDGPFYAELARAHRVDAWVVGLPIHADGNESDKSREARAFAHWLQTETELPVRMFDERFTTVEANTRLRSSGLTRDKKKRRVDAVAATVLLESYLEACRYRDGVAGCEIDWQPDSAPDEL